MKNSKLLKLARIMLRFATTLVGDVEWIHDGELSTGVEVYTEDENGELIPVADGEYETETNKIIVKDGKIEEITEINKEPQEPQEPKEPKEPAQTTEPMAAEPQEHQEPTEPQPDEKDVKINELTTKIAELQAKITVLTEELDTKNDLIEELQEKLVKPLENPIIMSATLRDGNGKQSGAMKYFE